MEEDLVQDHHQVIIAVVHIVVAQVVVVQAVAVHVLVQEVEELDAQEKIFMALI
jgi:hypothetical protein